MNRTLALLAAIGFSFSAWAQAPANWVGTYKITWPAERGHTLEAKMELTAAGAGTWQTYAARGVGDRNPCVGREVPIQVEEASEREAKILLKFADALPGCKNATVQLKAGDNNTITGTRGKADLTIEKR
jgi:hypothetical protein